MSAHIDSFPLPTSSRFGLKLRWAIVAAALILAAVLGGILAFQGHRSVKVPAAPAQQIQAPAQPGGASLPAPVPNPRGCGLSVRGGPC